MTARTLLLCLCCVGGLMPSVSAVTVECRTQPARFGRMVFDRGTEALVFPGCRFVVVKDESVIADGTIELSVRGYAISAADPALDSLSIDSTVFAQIDCFMVDTSAVLRIGCLEQLNPSELFSGLSLDSGKLRSAITTYQSQFSLLSDFQAGKLDAIITDYAPRLDGVTYGIVSSPAPWVVALAPRPSSARAQDGVITTSLFYRFDPASLPLIADGDSATAWNTLDAGSSGRRPYPFNPETGRRLWRTRGGRDQALSIGCASASLLRTAEFFADVLSRDRVTMSVVSSLESKTDLQLLAIPLFATGDTVSLRTVIDALAGDTLPGMAINETIAQAAFHLAAAEVQPDSVLRDAAVRRARAKLTEDAGVFPLYRPRLFFTHRTTVIGVGTDSSGRFDLAGAQVLLAPPYLEGQ